MGGHVSVSATYFVSPVRCEPLHVDLARKQHLPAMLISAQPPNAAHACVHLAKLVLQMRQPAFRLLSYAMLPSPRCATVVTSAWIKSFWLWVLPHQ